MKKLLAIILIACTLFSMTALAAETTFVEPFTLLDFGSDSRLDDMWKPNLLSGIEKYNCAVEENEDSWTLTAINTDEYANGVSKSYKVVSGFMINKISQITYGSLKINNGWGTYAPKAYSQLTGWTYNTSGEWQGKNQFMKIRLKNMTENTTVSFMASSSGNFGGDWVLAFDIEANDTEFSTYVVDLAVAAGRGFFKSKGVGVEGVVPGAHQFSNLVPWVGTGNNIPNTDVLILHLFGALTPADADNTSKNVKEGATVELDYLIFAATPELAAEYKSIDEGYEPDETTTTEKVETTTTTQKVEETTTTTQKVEETTTTTAKVEETTTTVADETTTTVADETTTTVADETTTTVADETTTTVADETTTTVAGETTTTVADETTTVADETTTTVADETTTTVAENNDSEGGFPVWIIIVIVVVIGGGVAAIFVFKKK